MQGRINWQRDLGGSGTEGCWESWVGRLREVEVQGDLRGQRGMREAEGKGVGRSEGVEAEGRGLRAGRIKDMQQFCNTGRSKSRW